MEPSVEAVDCAVIGAGWYGLAAAKQYHYTFPDDSLVVYDSQSSIGGTWAEERLYPDLKSNHLLGSYEYPDFPMQPIATSLKIGKDHIPGPIIHSYLNAYASHFSIDLYIRLKTKVTAAEHQNTENGGWVLSLVVDNKESQILARRLIVATGLTSEPIVRSFTGQNVFGGPVFHGKEFPQNKNTLQEKQSVTILGGSKFAWDAAYSYAKSGVEVHWVISASGHGPCWMTPPFLTPMKVLVEKVSHTRLTGWFSPCIWGGASGFYRIQRVLHGTALGRWIVEALWSLTATEVQRQCRLDSDSQRAKLKPWLKLVYAASSFSILNYEDDFFDIIQGDNVTIHISNIETLSQGKVHLSDGTAFRSEALLAHTGWQQVPPLKFLPPGIEAELGLPHLNLESSSPDRERQSYLLKKADEEITRKFPSLKAGPIMNKNAPETQNLARAHPQPPNPLPFALHRFMVPVSLQSLQKRDIVYAGMLFNFSTATTAHIQSVWISAYFSDRLKRSPSSALKHEEALEALRYEAILHNRFGYWRHPTDWGDRAPSFVYDSLTYFGLLLHDLGVSSRRKSSYMAEILQPYGPRDFENVYQEWQENAGAYSCNAKNGGC